MNIKKASLLGAVTLPLILSGCSSLGVHFKHYPDPKDETDPIKYMIEWRKVDLETASVKFVGLKMGVYSKDLDTPNVYTDDGYRFIGKGWCSRYRGVSNHPKYEYDLHSAIALICSNNGGEVTHGLEKLLWCKKPNDDYPLFGFYSDFDSSGLECSQSSPPYHFQIVAPLDEEHALSKAWLRKAEYFGFISERVAKAQKESKAKLNAFMEKKAKEKRDREARERRRLIEAERIRVAKETPVISRTRGLQICKRFAFDQEYPHYVGFVEGFANGKIQVRVNEKVVRPGWADANFKSKIIWDDPKKWRICE